MRDVREAFKVAERAKESIGCMQGLVITILIEETMFLPFVEMQVTANSKCPRKCSVRTLTVEHSNTCVVHVKRL